MANNQDHVWHILRDVLELLAGSGIPTPERGYALDGGWSLALSDLRRLVNDRNALRAQIKTVIAERDQLRAELAAAKEHLGIAINNAAGWRKRTAERRQKMKELAAHVERLVGALECVPVDLIHAIENGDTGANVFLSAGSCKLIGDALAATPAQSLAAHDAAVKVAVLREVANKLRNEESANSSLHAEFIEAEAVQIKANADRIAKEAPHA